MYESSDNETQSHTPIPLRRQLSLQSSSATAGIELNPKKMLRTRYQRNLESQRSGGRRRSLDHALSFGSKSSWTDGLLQMPINLYFGRETEEEEASSEDSECPPATQWQAVAERTAKAVVTVRFCQAVSFDTTGAVSTEATGFVVDKARGIILTNRHVACAGPFVGEAIFENREQVDVHAIYRDPIHDFGFLKYSPDDVRYHDVHEIELDPLSARVGTEIRVIGNDSGEELSILAGYISKVDRNVPNFGPMAYNDFNTFYLQAASSSSGGSSGSPVVDIQGNAIGMQTAGRTQSATDFFMPLDRVKRALRMIQQEKPVKRGDIQVQFLFKPFDYIRRIGMSESTEARIRALDKRCVGMLVAETVLPEGPGDRAGIMAGDVLISIDSQFVTGFTQLNELLDSSIGKRLAIVVERDYQQVELMVDVEDVASITPDRYLSIGGAILHDLSYQLARYYCVPARGVYLANASGMLPLEDAGEGILIKSVDGQPMHSLDDFIRVISQLPDRAQFPVVYYSLNDINEIHVFVAENERHWTDMDLFTRNDSTGVWDRHTMDPAPLPLPHVVSRLSADDELAGNAAESAAQFATLPNAAASTIAASLVQVHFYMPWLINAFPISRRTGTGLVVDAAQGLVVVSRSIVPFELGDLSIIFEESLKVSATVVYLHSTLNFAIVKYDPHKLRRIQVRSASISAAHVSEGDRLLLHAYDQEKGICTIKASVSQVSPMSIPKHNPPRFRSINANWFKLDTKNAQKYNTGVLTDGAAGQVRGLWVSYIGDAADEQETNNEYFYGFDACLLLPVLDQMKEGCMPAIYALGVEFTTISFIEARHLGLDRKWIERIRNHNSNKSASYNRLLMINRIACDSECAGALQPLDILLELDGDVVTQLEDLYHVHSRESVNLTILRNMKSISVVSKTDRDLGVVTERIVQWAGAIVHMPHLAVRQQCRRLPSKVYISYSIYGSPAYAADLAPTSFITHVGDIATPDLDSFVAALRDLSAAKSSHTYVRIVGIDMIPEVVSLKLNAHYWPTIEVFRDKTTPSGWNRIHHDDNGCVGSIERWR